MRDAPTKVLVTGGAGFIGSHLVRALVRMGCEMMVFDDLSTGCPETLPEGVALEEGDIRDRNCVVRLMARWQPEVVFHLAGQASVRRSIADEVTDLDVNVKGAIHIFQASARNAVRKVIFASSGGAIYGEQDSYPASEEVAPKPRSPYGVDKLAAELYGASFDLREGFDFTSLRLANVYGPGQDPNGEAGVISIFLTLMAEGRPMTVFGDGEQTRDFIFVEDVVSAFLKAMPGPAGVYNIGTGVETSLNTVLGLLGRIDPKRTETRYVAAIPGEVRRNVLSIRRAKEILGWTPLTPLAEGLLKTFESHKSANAAGGKQREHQRCWGPGLP